MSAPAILTRPPERYADLLDAMRDLLDATIAIPESDLLDDWLDSVKDAGIPASRYSAMPARLVLRTLESSGDAVREVDRNANGTGVPKTLWGGRGYVPRTPHVAARIEPKAKGRATHAQRAFASKDGTPTPAKRTPADDTVSLACLRAELAQIKAQVQRIESQIGAMEGRA